MNEERKPSPEDTTIGERFMLDPLRKQIPVEWAFGRRLVARVVLSRPCEAFMATFICLTFVIVVIDTNRRAKYGSSHQEEWIHVANNIIFAVYAIELVARLYVSRLAFFTRGWDMFDFFVVTSEVVSMVSEIVMGQKATSLSWLRLLRVMRVLRLFRVFKRFSELNMLVHGITSAFKAIFWATIMMMMSVMVWSVVAVEIIHPVVKSVDKRNGFDSCPRCSHAFMSVTDSILTFTQIIIAGDSWGTYANPIIEESPFTFILFILVTATIQFGLMNLILAVIVDRAQQARLDDTELQLDEIHQKFLSENRNLLKWCKMMDRDGKEFITKEDLMWGWSNIDDFRDNMKLMNLSDRDLDIVFEILDLDNSNSLTYAEFVEQLFTLRTADVNCVFIYTLHHVSRIVGAQASVLKDMIRCHNTGTFSSIGGHNRPSLQSNPASENMGNEQPAVVCSAVPDKTIQVAAPLLDSVLWNGHNEKGAIKIQDDNRIALSILSLQSDIEKDLNRLNEKIQDQDTQLKRFADDLFTQFQHVSRVLPETTLSKHGDLLRRTQAMENTLLEGACALVSRVGKQKACIAELEGFIGYRANTDPGKERPGIDV